MLHVILKNKKKFWENFTNSGLGMGPPAGPWTGPKLVHRNKKKPPVHQIGALS
jgi:hypothetical protein